MRWLAAVIVALAPTPIACGRIEFAPRTDADTTADADTAADANTDDAFEASDPSLRFYMPFDGNAVDLVASRTASCVNCRTYTVGKRAMAAVFDGQSCLTVANEPTFNTQTFTIAAWFWVDAISLGTVMSKPYQPATSISNSYEMFTNMTGLAFATYTTSANTDEVVTGPYQPSTWHHGAITFDGTTKRAYLDGIPGETSLPGPILFDDADLHIGCDIDAGAINSPLTGRIDELRFYERALSSTELAALAANL